MFDEAFARNYLGGNGFAMRLLYERLAAGVDPLAPENIIVLAVSPATDTLIPGATRCCVGTESPLTGLFCDSTFGDMFATTAFECFERGPLHHDRTGRPLQFGDYHTLLDPIEATAYRRGFGDLLAEGSARLAGQRYVLSPRGAQCHARYLLRAARLDA